MVQKQYFTRKYISNKLVIFESDKKKMAERKNDMFEKNQWLQHREGSRHVREGTLLLGNDKNADKVLRYF